MSEVNKVSNDMAEADFDRFVESMDLDVNTSKMDNEDLTAFNKQKDRVIRAIELGHLAINDDGEAVYTPHRPHSKFKEAITFHERTGASLMAMDNRKKVHDVAKTCAVLAYMCKVPANVFAGLVGPDIKICEALFAVLMD